MNIPIDNLTISSFCLHNSLHVKFVKDLKKDELTYQFVSTHIIHDFMLSKDSKEIESGKTYVIEKDKIPIAFIQLVEVTGKKKIVELRSATHPNYRGMGYGAKILNLCTNYLLDIDSIDGIELHIRKDNEISIRCAEKVKYKKIGKNDGEYYDIYQKTVNRT